MQKPTRTYFGAYTYDERKAILSYIIDNEGFFSLRGNSLWINMEKAKITNRTWQSMKQHFRMQIVNNLHCYNISKEDEKKIITGYNNTRTVRKSDDKVTHVPKSDYFAFSDEEKENEKSDDSSNLEFEVNEHRTSKKIFKKQIIQGKSTRPFCSDRDESISNGPSTSFVGNQLNTEPKCINLEKRKIENDARSLPISPNPNTDVNSVDETCIETSLQEDIKFLKTITRYNSNLISCFNIQLFIKEYAEKNNNIYPRWTELYDKFITMINNLQLYNFLAPEMVIKLLCLKEALVKYRSDGFRQDKKMYYEIFENGNETTYNLYISDPTVRKLISETLDKMINGELDKEKCFDLIKRMRQNN